MTDFEVKKHLSFSHKCLILMLLAFAFIFAFIPLWQLGVNNSLRTEMYLAGANIIDLDAEDRAIRAAISETENETNTQYMASVSISY
ncbi:MAG: hypothetical protein J6R23_05935 [Spirochaetales bacterium]|jgi:hypothetical protein|nr:hypothetical protein [Spirochaetales bacterium]MBQ2259046.1 hypothetical protein [Spirochaetales bacterium]